MFLARLRGGESAVLPDSPACWLRTRLSNRRPHPAPVALSLPEPPAAATCAAGEGVAGSVCAPCSGGTVSAGGVGAVCTLCSVLQVPNANKTACVNPSCPPGQGLSLGGGGCENCSDSYQVSPGGDNAECAACAAGAVPNADYTGCVALVAAADTPDALNAQMIAAHNSYRSKHEALPLAYNASLATAAAAYSTKCIGR